MSSAHDIDDDDDAMSVTSSAMSTSSGPLARFAPSVATSATTVDWSMRSPSPAPSVFSVTASMRAASYRHEYGRGINNYSDVYRLPADDEELRRLDKQHLMFMDVMGKYPPPLAEVLADDTPGETKAVVDLGCGSGSWILDVARDFPHCSTVAVDLVPMQVLNMPDNCRSEVDDINLGLQHFYGDFNVVHARLVSSGIRDYASLVDQIAQTLRGGGLLDLLEFDFRVYDQHKRICLDNNTAPWFARWMNHCHVAVQRSGGTPDAANHLQRWVSEHVAFEDVVYREVWLPTSPWCKGKDPESVRQNRIAHVFREDVLMFLKSGRTLLLGSGLDQALVDELEERARDELAETRRISYIRVESVYARKRHMPLHPHPHQ